MKARIATAILVIFTGVVAFTAIANANEHTRAPRVTLSAIPGGDDRPDGQIDEDESGFDCGVDGNGSCGDWMTFRRWVNQCDEYWKRADRYRRCVEIGVLDLERGNFQRTPRLAVDRTLRPSDDQSWKYGASRCTRAAHDWPCISNGDNEPTVGGTNWHHVSATWRERYHWPYGCQWRVSDTQWAYCPDGRWSSS